MTITEARFTELLNTQSVQARKVFDCVPIGEAWPTRQIYSAITRNTRATMEYKVVEGCLDTLKESGLIYEPLRGLFQQVKPKAKTMQAREVVIAEPTDARPGSTADLLTELAERAHQLSLDLLAARDVLTEEKEANADGLRKLGQLQALLKGL